MSKARFSSPPSVPFASQGKAPPQTVPATPADRRVTRRRFLGASALAVGAVHLVPSGVLGAAGRPGASQRLVLGHIGVGGMGMTHVRNMLQFHKEGKVRIAAVCDVDENRLETAVKTAAESGEAAKPYRDYRALLERKDIDAVVIATPDHWHAVQTVHACECGKHVYVEKPASVTIEEGRAMVVAARKANVSVQVGAQGRNGKGAWYTCRAIRNGIVGRVHTVSCWHYANPTDDNPVPDAEPPPDLDWDLWLGPLPWRPYNRRYHPANFRWLLESGGGQIRDRGAHQFSTILWCLEADQQVSYTVEAKGTAPTRGLWDCPVDMQVVYEFKNPDWTLIWGQPGDKRGETEFGQTFIGDRGQLLLEWEGAYRPAHRDAIEFKLPAGGREVPRTDDYEDFNLNHKADWFRSIWEGHHRPAVDIEIGHRTATLCNLGNLSYILGRKLVWDGVQEQVVGDPEANRLLGKPQRYPYVL